LLVEGGASTFDVGGTGDGLVATTPTRPADDGVNRMAGRQAPHQAA